MIALLLLGCDDDIFPPVTGGEAIVGDGYDDAVAVFDGGCVSCHSAAGAPSFGGLDLQTDPCTTLVDEPSPNYGIAYVAAGDHTASLVWNKMAATDTDTYGGVMPSGGALPAASIETVAAWIDAGAPCGADGDTATDGAEP